MQLLPFDPATMRKRWNSIFCYTAARDRQASTTAMQHVLDCQDVVPTWCFVQPGSTPAWLRPERTVHEAYQKDVLVRELLAKRRGQTTSQTLTVLFDSGLHSLWQQCSAVRQLIMNNRYYGINFLADWDPATSLRPAVRSNIDYVFIPTTSRHWHTRSIYDHFLAFIDFDQFCTLFNAHRAPGRFLVLDTNAPWADLEGGVHLQKCLFTYELPTQTATDARCAPQLVPGGSPQH